MRTLTPEQLAEIIESHGKWLRDKEGGKKADLSCADLSSANLSSADLRCADLSCANLSCANLSCANLSYADLSSANLSSANLSSADLRSADLRSANLSYANLDKRYIQVACIGSRKDMTTYCFDDNWIWCGCWPDGSYTGGTLEEFEEAVKETHEDNPQYLAEYLGFIAYIRSLRVQP
jgi:hypothetical protein